MALASYDLSVKDRAFRTPKRERVTPHESTVTREPRDTIVPASSSKWNNNNLLSLLDSRNFSWLSPTSTVSTASSPVDSKDIWDPPETPYSSTDKTSPRDHQSPLTPPTPSVSSRKLRVTPVSKLSFDIETSSVSKRHFLDEDDVVLQSESYRPLKLFRDIDIEFEPISHKYTPSICVNYDMNPSFIFTHGSHNSIASRTRSKTSNKAPVTTEIHTASGREEGRVEAPHNPTNTPVQEGLRKLLEHIIPFDLHARLADTARLEKCVGSMAKAPSDRCNYKRKVQASLTGEDGILKSLASCKTKDDCVGMLSHIKEVIEAVMCRTHQHAAMRRLEEELGDVLQDESSKDVMIVEQVDRYTLGQWIDAICDPRASINRTSWYKNIAKNAKPDVLFKPRAASTQSQIQQPCSSDFIPYQTEKSRGQSVSSAIREKATSPLGSKDHSSGFVYLYWDKLYFGKVKIGYTDNLARRLKEWDKKCKREHIYHSNTESQVKMSHVHRVEQLIHAELKQCRYQRQCEGCGKLHKEWFEATEVHAIKVLKKWREWILQEPYVQDKKSGDWVIRPEMLDTLDRMCAPLPQEVVEQEHHKRNGGLQRVTPKKKKGNRRTI